jgi:hypothetical protein
MELGLIWVRSSLGQHKSEQQDGVGQLVAARSSSLKKNAKNLTH